MHIIDHFAGLGKPSAALLAQQEMRIYGIVHFGLNTYIGREWGMGDAPPELFNPEIFDAHQLVRAARDGGLQGLILVCKHHDGFCLWPTATTQYNISRSQWRNGKGDMVAEISAACRAEGLRFGVYVSPWDRNNAAYGTDRYPELFRQQLKEVLTGYGEIFEMWFDGANGGDGYYGGAREVRKIDASVYYDWEKTWRLVRELQPHAAIFSDVGPDRRWCGNERGYLAGDSVCSIDLAMPPDSPTVTPCPGNMDSARLNTGNASGRYYLMPECDFPLRARWFYHPDDDDRVRSAAKLLDIYLHSVGCGGTMNIGLAPDSTGRITEKDCRELRLFREKIDGLFRCRIFDAKLKTGRQIVNFDRPVEFNLIRLQEPFEAGEKISNCIVEGKIKDVWQKLFSVKAVGPCRLRHITPVTISSLRVTAEGVPEATLQLELFNADEQVFAIADDFLTRAERPEIRKVTVTGKTALLDLEETRNLAGLEFVPDDPAAPGTPDRFLVETGCDGTTWETVVPAGEFSNIQANPIPQEIIFSERRAVRYIRFCAVHTLSENADSLAYRSFRTIE